MICLFVPLTWGKHEGIDATFKMLTPSPNTRSHPEVNNKKQTMVPTAAKIIFRGKLNVQLCAITNEVYLLARFPAIKAHTIEYRV